MKPAFVFSDSFGHRLTRHLVFWLAWVLFFTFIYAQKGVVYYGLWHSYMISFVDALCFMPIHLFFSYAIMYFLMPQFLYTQRYGPLMLWMLALVIAAGIISYLSSEYLVGPVRLLLGVPRYPNSLAMGFMGGLRGGLTIGGFAAAIKLMKQWYVKKQENEMLEKARMESELQVLKAQLHPHFLFNTLNNIYSFAMQDTQTAPGMILRLSDMLRYMLYECEKPQVCLAREIQLLKDYVALEQMRYGTRLDVHIHVEGNLQERTIAPLLLLPFVENAFKHGASDTVGDVWMSIDIREESGLLKLKVINGKPGASAVISEQGIGLRNVRQRLELLYPGMHLLTISDFEDSFVVKLSLRLNTLASDQAQSAVPAKNLDYA
ncbi:MAG: sensor histidine kinase [Chitinophagaceae bacterium]